MRHLLRILTILLFPLTLQAQIDKEFWFVGPEASSNHGDRPVYVRVSTMEDPANITLRMPANRSFTPIMANIAPNSTITIQLDVIGGSNTWLDSIENRPADRVLNKGLLLNSDAFVTAYYEINSNVNPGIFPMKGKNGLGTEFYIPGQTNYANQNNNGTEAFDIVATQDTTTITITPSIDIVGHPANVPFEITLNKGETYSARTLNTSAAASLAGSHVVSDKPVAITISDDSIITGGWDIIGDQIIPVNLLGSHYIVIKGFAENSPPSNNDERVYILATQDATDIMIDGNPVPAGTINTGGQFNYAIPNTTNTVAIQATNPVYVYHLSGHPGEAGASILPHDSCTGSRKVGFNRSSSSAFALLILTRTGNEGSFILNGNSTTISAANFNVVPGTGGNWVFYRENNLTTTQVPVGANLLENTMGKFHLGILNNVSASSEYGYFSDFSTLYLGADASMCPGDSMVLDGGPFRTSYEWKKLVAGNWITVGTSQTYTVLDTGSFACITNGDFCLLMDTINVAYYPNGTVELGNDRTICEGTTTTFDPGAYQSYLWSTGETTPTLTTGQPGPLWVRVTNNNGCTARDTVVIVVDSLPLANAVITGPDTVCNGSGNVIYSIDTLDYAVTYAWTVPPGATGASTSNTIALDFSAATSGPLTVHGVNNCGIGQDITLPVTVKPLPGPAGPVTGPASVCQGVSGLSYSIPPVAGATSILWILPPGCTLVSGAGTASITVDIGAGALSGNITATGQNDCGSGITGSLFLQVGLTPVAAGPVTGPGTVCQGQQNAVYTTGPIAGAASYIWSLPTGAAIVAGAGTNTITVSFDSTAQPGNLAVYGHSPGCGEGQPFSMTLTVNPLPAPAGVISGTSAVCQGMTSVPFAVPATPYATSYIWTLPPGCTITSGAGTNAITTTFSTGATAGVIRVRGHNATCGDGRSSAMTLAVNPLPLSTGSISGPTPLCQGATGIAYTVQNVDPATNTWNWTLMPPGAGSLSGATAPVLIDWDNNFTGTATLTVQGANGCGTGPVSLPFPVQVDRKPEVSYNACGDLATTKNGRAIILKGGSPAGPAGIYSGTGVSLLSPGVYDFDPAVAAVIGSPTGTPYVITYRYTNTYQCYREATRTIRVYPSNAFDPCPGSVTDVRDGKSYATFSTGSGVQARCWMAENLNYGSFADDMVPQTDNCTTEKYCPGNSAAGCAAKGGYYQWPELMNYTATLPAQGLCPPGWHIPSEQEWIDLGNYYLGPAVAGSALKDPAPVAGFHGLLTGILYHNNLWAFNAGANTGVMYWTSAAPVMGRAVARGLNAFNPSVSRYASATGNALPARCVRDY